MSASSESKGPAILFLLFWYGYAQNPWTESNAFFFAIATFFGGWACLRLVATNVQRLGKTGWIVLAKLVIAVSFLMVLLPAGPEAALTLALLGGLPLLVVAIFARWAFDRLPDAARDFARRFCWFLLLPGFAANLALGFWMGDAHFAALVSAALTTITCVIPCVFGWQLGAPAAAHREEARFADAETLRKRGLADDL